MRVSTSLTALSLLCLHSPARPFVTNPSIIKQRSFVGGDRTPTTFPAPLRFQKGPPENDQFGLIKLDILAYETNLKINSFLVEASSNLLRRQDGIRNSTSFVTDAVLQALTEKLQDGIKTKDVMKDAAESTSQFVNFANEVMEKGWLSLFREREVSTVSRTDSRMKKVTEMSILSGAVYDPDTWEEAVQNDLNHAIVANGTVADISYLISDSVSEGELVRTITFRGFDASDGDVDREKLLHSICSAEPMPFKGKEGVFVHSGLMKIAVELYEELGHYTDSLGKNHKVVLNGHSVGGSLSILFMMNMLQERGEEYTKSKISQIYTFGSPPIATTTIPSTDAPCPILSALNLPVDFIQSFIQPWDPIVRLFTPYDPLYPLIDDLGADGVTPYANGPPRTLRPIVKALAENWAGWPEFREIIESSLSQNYVPIGTCYIMLPETMRYLTDRLVSVFIEVPPIDLILKFKGGGKEVLDILDRVFPLSVFTISIVPVAVRSFVHHFFPAYSNTIGKYVDGVDGDNSVDKGLNVKIDLSKNEKEWDGLDILNGEDVQPAEKVNKIREIWSRYSFDWKNDDTDVVELKSKTKGNVIKAVEDKYDVEDLAQWVLETFGYQQTPKGGVSGVI